MTTPLRIFLIAGEASGDRLGAALMRGLRAESDREIAFFGVGGAAMAAEGLSSLFPMHEISVMGLMEVLPRLRSILRRMGETAAAVIELRPDAMISIDAPAFSLRVAKRARRKLEGRTRFIHYVAPSVWAWRPKRAEKMARHVDHLMALLPFEPPYFERVGLSCDFVGHPVVESAATVRAVDQSLRAEFKIAPEAPVLAVLLGSREGEVSRLTPLFRETVRALARRRPNLVVLAPAAEAVAGEVTEALTDWPVRAHVVDPRGRVFAEAEARKLKAMAAADVALAASGTVSLELAAMRTPMAIGYRVNPISAAIARRLIKVDTATLVNLVSETRKVRDFLQEYFVPEDVAGVLDDLLNPNSVQRAAQLAASAEAMRRLGEGDAPPSVRAARSVLRVLESGGDLATNAKRVASLGDSTG